MLPLNLVNRFTGSLVVEVAVLKIVKYSILAYRITYRKNYNPICIQFIKTEGHGFHLIGHILAFHPYGQHIARSRTSHLSLLKNYRWISFEFQIYVCVGVFVSISQARVIYHQTMTPTWLEAHASYIDSSRTATAEQLTFNAGSVNFAALLKVPMLPAGFLKPNTPLTVEIIVAHDVNIGKVHDSDINYGISDGTNFIGFETCDKGNYVYTAPCYKTEGSSGTRLSTIKHGPLTPKPSDSFYPGQFVLTLKLDERWGSCYTAHDGGFVKTAGYRKRLTLNKGLILETYKSGRGEKVGIKFIKVTIIQDGA